VVTLIGCGAQAKSQLRALAVVLPLAEVRVLDREVGRAEAFARKMATELGVNVHAAGDLTRALSGSDICVTCTTSKSPVLGLAMIAPGAFVAAVGADNPEKHEIDPGVLRDSKVVVDSLAQCAQIGDLHHALDAGVMSEGDVHAELGAIVAGLAPGREHTDEVIVFDSTGMGLQDVASAAVVFERAILEGRGLRVDLAATA